MRPVTYSIMRFQVLMAASVKMIVFRYIAPCSLVEVDDVSEMRTASIIRPMNDVMISVYCHHFGLEPSTYLPLSLTHEANAYMRPCLVVRGAVVGELRVNTHFHRPDD
jgi:hypothetical protein